jgi:xanthine dehydrogenase accessory factor
MKEIRAILDLYDQLKQEAIASAMAIVVDVAESSYRRVGARLLVAADGRYVGGISGGCLEGDALRRARTAILANQPSSHVYDTLDGEDAVIGIGLGCEGRIEVLFLPLDYSSPENEVEVLRSIVNTRQPLYLARLLKAKRQQLTSHPLYKAGHISSLEKMVDSPLQKQGKNILSVGRSKVINLNEEGQEKYRIHFEVIQPQIHLIVTGTNYDIPPALAAARQLGWRTTVVGPRRKFTSTIAALADGLVDYSDVSSLAPDAATAVVLMSHDFDWDKKMVEHFLPLLPAYFGMLGPKKRAKKMDELLRKTTNLKLLDYPNLYSPVGLDIGAETPEEIAASLVAEVVMVFRGRGGGELRSRASSIHFRE